MPCVLPGGPRWTGEGDGRHGRSCGLQFRRRRSPGRPVSGDRTITFGAGNILHCLTVGSRCVVASAQRSRVRSCLDPMAIARRSRCGRCPGSHCVRAWPHHLSPASATASPGKARSQGSRRRSGGRVCGRHSRRVGQPPRRDRPGSGRPRQYANCRRNRLTDTRSLKTPCT
jgi:hypothetical protein